MARRKKSVSLPKFKGDHGTGTTSAIANTTIEAVEGDANRMGRRRRHLQSAKWASKLSIRQLQAAQAIEKAYARVEAIGSGGDSIAKMLELQTIVDASPKPDAVIDMQIGAQSHLQHVMKAVPSAMRHVIEHLFWHNRPLGQFVQGRSFYERNAEVKVALDLVANQMRF